MTNYIQSIQTFSITIASGSASNTATISAVTTANSVIFFGGMSDATNSLIYANWSVRLELTNATTVTANRNTAATGAVTVVGTVVEFTSGALEGSGVQTGTISIGTSSASNTATISSVTTANSVVFYLGHTTNGSSSNAPNLLPKLALTNSTTVTASINAGTASTSLVVGYAVVDFASAVLQSIQARSVTLTSANTSDTDTISSVTTGNTLLIYNGATTANSTISNFLYNLQLTNGTTVTLTRTGTNTASRTINYTVLEFASGVLNSSVQRGTITLNSVTSNTATISSVTTAKSVCNWVGINSTATNYRESETTAVLTNSTTVTGSKDTAGSTTTVVSYEVAEFPSATPPSSSYIFIGPPL